MTDAGRDQRLDHYLLMICVLANNLCRLGCVGQLSRLAGDERIPYYFTRMIIKSSYGSWEGRRIELFSVMSMYICRIQTALISVSISAELKLLYLNTCSRKSQECMFIRSNYCFRRVFELLKFEYMYHILVEHCVIYLFIFRPSPQRI